jgi:hypothetical protein
VDAYHDVVSKKFEKGVNNLMKEIKKTIVRKNKMHLRILFIYNCNERFLPKDDMKHKKFLENINLLIVKYNLLI